MGTLSCSVFYKKHIPAYVVPSEEETTYEKTYSLLDLFRPCTSRRCYAAPQYERFVLVLAGLALVLAGFVLVNLFFKLKNIKYKYR
jgi:hypothetical protein